MKSSQWIRIVNCGIAWSFLGLMVADAQEAAPAAVEESVKETALTADTAAVTVITSEKLTFDHKKQFAEFEANVVVTDPSMTLTADYMKVWFDADNQVKIIEAKGHVYIRQLETEAWAGRAEYLVSEGKIVLREKPKMTRGKDLLTGDVITFFREENKMVVTPRARLVIFPEKGQSNFSLTGE